MDVWLSFRDIEYVTAIAKFGGISQAAEKLLITQPALSIYLSKLEERLGTKLFYRVGRKFVLTYAGECVLKEGRRILSIRDQLQFQLGEIVQHRAGRLRVGFPYARGISFFAPTLKAYQERYPNVDVVVSEDDSRELERRLVAGELDVAFFSRIHETGELDFIRILEDPMVLYTCEDAPLLKCACEREGFRHPWIDLRLCAGEKFVLNFPEQTTCQLTERIFADYGIRPQATTRVKNQLTAIHLAAVGCGLYLAPEYFSYNIDFSHRLAILTFGEQRQYTMDYIAAWRKEVSSVKLIQDFVRCAQNVYSNAPRPGPVAARGLPSFGI